MSNDDREVNENSPAVQAHLTIEQSVIQRMATNSSSCKAWCITLVSAILVVIADKGKPNLAFLAFIPVVLFFALDSYYLALEKMFRNSYNDFIKKLHSRAIQKDDLYSIAPAGNQACITVEAMTSFSIWPFYATLAIMIVVLYTIVL